ncbi:DNA primase [Lactobacillus corticis]|uniref:DNA primase n=1 Tax=Lactobacillus corticis TaxID=2201249 RepID=A0A916QGV1_9LACO|nr:DNA primase [Lactobacillus corticis]GFZ27049.1 DNA primase [Lactobacillus corticis]
MAGKIPEDFINEVRNNVNIVDVISQYVSLEKKGKDYLGLCPFHQEKTPSFTVNEEKQFFKCFGCGKGGNVFKFLMYKDNLTFPESVQQVAEFAHMTMPQGYGQPARPVNPLVKIQEAAAEFYHQVLLTTKAGQRGLEYAKSRSLSPEIIKHFLIGYAPDNDSVLLTYLKGQGFKQEELVQSGLFVQSQDGRLFDRFRDRLMFPLQDENGHTIGFSGRRLSNDKTIAKYVNSPETKLFTKSKVLFHFKEAKQAARSEGHLVLYEGYMDVIAAYKAGIHAGIASMGTSLTDEQVYLLKRVSRNIIINYDGDDAGQHASERAIRLFKQAGGFNLGVVSLPEKLDPDEYVKKYGIEKYQAQIRGAQTTTDFFLKQLEKKYNLTNDREKLAFVDEAVNQLAQLTNPVEQDMYVERVAKLAGVTPQSIKANLSRKRRQQRTANRRKYDRPEPAAEPQIQYEAATTKTDPVQQRLLFLFLHAEKARQYLLAQHFLFPSSDYAQVAELWLKYEETHENPTVDEFIDFVPDELQGIIVSAEMANMPETFTDQELPEQIFALQLRQINQEIQKQLQALEEAKSQQDGEKIIELTKKILELKRLQGKREAF